MAASMEMIDLIQRNLEQEGILTKIRAQLLASVVNILNGNEMKQPKDLVTTFLSTDQGESRESRLRESLFYPYMTVISFVRKNLLPNRRRFIVLSEDVLHTQRVLGGVWNGPAIPSSLRTPSSEALIRDRNILRSSALSCLKVSVFPAPRASQSFGVFWSAVSLHQALLPPPLLPPLPPPLLLPLLRQNLPQAPNLKKSLPRNSRAQTSRESQRKKRPLLRLKRAIATGMDMEPAKNKIKVLTV
jgi:hypothetical protein